MSLSPEKIRKLEVKIGELTFGYIVYERQNWNDDIRYWYTPENIRGMREVPENIRGMREVPEYIRGMREVPEYISDLYDFMEFFNKIKEEVDVHILADKEGYEVTIGKQEATMALHPDMGIAVALAYLRMKGEDV